MQLKALRYFVMVAANGSFLATARHFRVPASSVSRFIAALEEELGRQLFYRSTRAVRLTEDGERFLLQVRESLELLDHAVEQIGQRDSGLSGLLRINAPEALGRLHIAGLVNELQAEHPGLTVELTLTDTFIDPVQEGADITIRIGPLVDSGLVGKVIGASQWVLAGSPAYLAAHGTPKQPEDLFQHQCLQYQGQLGAQKWYFRRAPDMAYTAFDVSGPLRSNNGEALVAAALAGRGIVLFPQWLFQPGSFREGRLVTLLPEWQASVSAEPTYIQLLSPQNRLRSAKVREVSEFLTRRIGTPPYWDAADTP